MSDLFVQRLRARKEALGLTVRDISDRADIPKRTIDKWFMGGVQPNLRQLTGLCRALECSIDYLAGAVPDPQASVDIDAAYDLVINDLWSRGTLTAKPSNLVLIEAAGVLRLARTNPK